MVQTTMPKAFVIFGWCVRLFLFNGSLKANGVILNDMVQRLGTTNSMVGWAFALQQGVSYGICPFASLLLIVVTKRQLAVAGGFVVGISYICCGLFVQSLWQLFFVYICSGIGFGFNMLGSYFSLLEHFYENLGTVVSATSLFNFVGLAILPVVLQYFKESFGLSQGLALFGCLLLNLVVSAVASTITNKSIRTDQILGRETQEESCPYVDCEMEQVEDQGRLRRYFQSWREVFFHENAAIIIALTGLVSYIYISWGLFLVSVGTSAGLSAERAVLLSTAGGIGGMFGKLIAVVLFQIKRMNAFTSSMIPLLCNALSLLGCSMAKDLYIMLICTFITGVCIGWHDSGLFGLLPSVVCTYHYQKAYLILVVIRGITMQLGGLVSGLIVDITGSALYVFFTNAILSFAGLPFVCLWACSSSPEKRSDG